MAPRRPRVPLSKKPTNSTKKKSPPRSALDVLSADDAQRVLFALLERRPALRTDAESIARTLLDGADTDVIAEDVCSAISTLGYDDVNGRAGTTRDGHVELVDAAGEVLDEALEEYRAQMRRRIESGSIDAAVSVGLGIVAGLYDADESQGELLKNVPDYATEAAGWTLDQLLKAVPRDAKSVRERITRTLEERTPSWSEWIDRRLARPHRSRT